MELENPNIFQPDGGGDLYDSHERDNIQVRCPHCQCTGTFPSAIKRYFAYGKSYFQQSVARSGYFVADIRQCPNQSCRGIVFTLSEQNGAETKHHCFPPELLEFNPENLPPRLISTLKEATICHSHGAYRACAMMVRRLLEELCEECGVSGPNLHTRLKELRSHITLPEELFDAMDELKVLGNDAAHIEAKAFMTIDKEEAQLSIELAQEILKARYQHKGLLDRLRARKSLSSI